MTLLLFFNILKSLFFSSTALLNHCSKIFSTKQLSRRDVDISINNMLSSEPELFGQNLQIYIELPSLFNNSATKKVGISLSLFT